MKHYVLTEEDLKEILADLVDWCWERDLDVVGVLDEHYDVNYLDGALKDVLRDRPYMGDGKDE